MPTLFLKFCKDGLVATGNCDKTVGSTVANILLVDDDSELCSLMSDFFTGHGFTLESVHDGRLGLARALEGGFDLILLDVMLPVLNGFEVLAQIRRRSSVPVIMLTARIEQLD